MQSAKHFSPLSNDQLERAAPAVFATDPHEEVSERYGFVPTIEVVNALRDSGFYPVWAAQPKVRKESRRGVAKHMLRFRRPDAKPITKEADSIPEVVLVNAHDRTSSFQLHAGLFRMVCSNGMVVADQDFDTVKVRHNSEAPGHVVEGSYRVIEELPQITSQVERFQALPLGKQEQRAYAEAAMATRWEDPNKAPITWEQLVQPRRPQDREEQPTVWGTYNRVQENLFRGGLQGRSANNRRTRTRPINSVDENSRVNRALWTLADRLAEHVETTGEIIHED